MSIDVGFRSQRGPVLIALMVTTFLVAIEATILATAIPTIVDELGGFSEFPWLFSVYLLTQAVTVPIYSKLSDMIGRKPVVLFGIAVFLVGSILCGLAWSMPALIAFRAIQGLGAGAILPMAITIAGDIYTVQERAKVQGYLASVWAVASVVGPSLGGIFAQFDLWRAIFFVNIPLCIVSAWMLMRNFDERVEKRKHKVDFLGAGLLAGALTLLILAILEGGQAWAWNSPQSIGAFTVGAVLLAAFVWSQTRAAEPILPLWVFTRRLLLTTTLLGLGLGAILIGITSYVPTYLEGTLGVAPLVAGLALATFSIGWPIAAAVAGRFYLRIGFRSTALLGLAFVFLGAVGLAAFALTPTVWLVALWCFIIGLGMGLTATPSLIAAQSSVEWSDRGVVTGANLFARTIGSAVGVAIFGAVANSIFGPGDAATIPAEAIAAGSAAVFVGVVLVVLAAGVAAFAMPKTPAPVSAR